MYFLCWILCTSCRSVYLYSNGIVYFVIINNVKIFSYQKEPDNQKGRWVNKRKNPLIWKCVSLFIWSLELGMLPANNASHVSQRGHIIVNVAKSQALCQYYTVHFAWISLFALQYFTTRLHSSFVWSQQLAYFW